MSHTSLPMLVAKELECDWSNIRVEPVPVDPVYNHTEWGNAQGTGGSSSVRSTWKQFRKAGATARVMLVKAAADIWKVDTASCRAEKGFVIHAATKRKLAYGKLVRKAAQMETPQDVPLKEPKDFKIIGKSMKRLDTPEKVNGKGIFGMDAKVAGMLAAVVARPPVFGGKVKSFNADKAKALRGVKEVVQINSGVAVVADHFWQASRGRDALEIIWEEGDNASLSTAGMREEYARLARTPGAVAKKRGKPEQAIAKAAVFNENQPSSPPLQEF